MKKGDRNGRPFDLLIYRQPRGQPLRMLLQIEQLRILRVAFRRRAKQIETCGAIG